MPASSASASSTAATSFVASAPSAEPTSSASSGVFAQTPSIEAVPTAEAFFVGSQEVTFLLKNQSEHTLRYSDSYQLWSVDAAGGLSELSLPDAPPVDPLAPPTPNEGGETPPVFLLPGGEQTTLTISLAPFGTLKAGSYRLAQLCTLLSPDTQENLATCTNGACTEISADFTLTNAAS